MGEQENKVVTDSLELFERYGINAWRNNNVRVPGRVFIGEPGAADIFALLPPYGTLCAVECKTKTGVQSDDQKKFEAKVKAAGGIYILARNTDPVLARLNTWRANMRAMKK